MTIQDTFRLAVEHHRAGRLAEAEAICRQILGRQPDHADALHLLGMIARQVGRPDLAMQFIGRAISVRPSQAEFHGRMGSLLLEAGRMDEAVISLNRSIELNPNLSESHNDLGCIHRQRGSHDQAVVCFERALALSPDFLPSLFNLGATLCQTRQFERAVAVCRRLVDMRPDDVEGQNNLGEALHKLGRNKEALVCFQTALSLAPDLPDSHFNLAVVLAAIGRLDEAIASYEKALSIQPDHYGALNNLGTALDNLGNFDRAIASYRRAMALRPSHPQFPANLSLALRSAGRFDEAVAAAAQAVAVAPNDVGAHWNYALILLSLGRFEKGWEEFEWRLRVPHLHLDRGFEQKQWNGADLAGQTLLLHAEGGFGDAIQFVRYVPMLRGRGARLILECQSSLVSLFERIDGVDQIIARGQPLPPFDLHCPLPSLPRIFRTRLDTIPNSVPYLSVPPERLELWAGRVPRDGLRNVGLVWSGNAKAKPPGNRLHSLEVFAPLAELTGMRFISLQLGQGADEPRPPGLNLLDLTADIRDFADTAALLSQLNLLISVDTSVTHLAGALARSVWIPIPFQSEFRWMFNRDDSPWYPTARLFRQPAVGDWKTPIRRIVKELRSL